MRSAQNSIPRGAAVGWTAAPGERRCGAARPPRMHRLCCSRGGLLVSLLLLPCCKSRCWTCLRVLHVLVFKALVLAAPKAATRPADAASRGAAAVLLHALLRSVSQAAPRAMAMAVHTSEVKAGGPVARCAQAWLSRSLQAANPAEALPPGRDPAARKRQVTAGGEVAALRHALASARLALRIFFSLNSPGLTEARLCCHPLAPFSGSVLTLSPCCCMLMRSAWHA